MGTTIFRETLTFEEFKNLTIGHGAHESWEEYGGDGSSGVQSMFHADTWREVESLAQHGFKVDFDVDKLLSYVETDLSEGLMDSFYTTFDVAGDEVDMGRYLAGEPENMMTSAITKVMRTGRVVSLYVPLSISAMVNANEYEARGRTVLALLEAFRRKQHPVEIWGVIANHVSHNRCAVLIKIQDATQPIDDSQIMFALAHPAMPRGLGWRYKDLRSAEDRYVRQVWSKKAGYGSSSRDVQDDDLTSDKQHSIVLKELTHHEKWTDDKWAAAWIEKALEKIEEGAI